MILFLGLRERSYEKREYPYINILQNVHVLQPFFRFPVLATLTQSISVVLYLHINMILMFYEKEVEVNATVMPTSHWIDIMCQIKEKNVLGRSHPQPTNN